MREELLAVPIQRADDVFVLRQRARDAAAAAGFEEVDQVRVATALSELGRELLPTSGSARRGPEPDGRAAFSLTDGGTTLTVSVTGLPAGAARSGRVAAALSAARRLIDDVELVAPSKGSGAGARGGGGSVILRKRLPAGRASTPARVRAALAAAPTSPLDELRAQNLQQTRRQGSGLGLPYARRVVHALGGTLGLHSEVGVGSTFTITLPVRWVEALARTTSPGGTAAVGVAAAPVRPGSVEVGLALVVDDDEGFRHILRGMLQGMAEQVIEAGNGQEALARMETVRPDVVFLDLRMPDMDGSEVLARMEDLPVRDVPVVIVSSIDLTGPDLFGLGRSAATLAKASLDQRLLAATLAAVLSGDREAITGLSSGETEVIPAPLPAPLPDPSAEP